MITAWKRLLAKLRCVWFGHDFEGYFGELDLNPNYWRKCTRCGAIHFWIN